MPQQFSQMDVACILHARMTLAVHLVAVCDVSGLHRIPDVTKVLR